MDDDFVVVLPPVLNSSQTQGAAVSYECSDHECEMSIDLNTFLQDIEKSFKQKTRKDTFDATWTEIWSQFQKDLPRECLTVNGQHLSDVNEAYDLLQKLVGNEDDVRLIIMLCQQCVVALPFEILSQYLQDPENSIFLGETTSPTQAGEAAKMFEQIATKNKLTTNCNRKTAENGNCKKPPSSSANLCPQRLNITVSVQDDSDKASSSWWPGWTYRPETQTNAHPSPPHLDVDIFKLFRLFDANTADTLCFLQLHLQFDLKKDHMLQMRWTPYPFNAHSST
eukprot:TRINITY_DN62096_c0_g1_i1.p1 TRINITY_DN62096_c0_g1~~TRINITY_DN62096_c0_g1_i1.p1  ORF type:complete len:281 (-),score=20.71 TRINITY_DN62096_c0_g1_i1:233-1075(-)